MGNLAGFNPTPGL
uniref:Uncharacterized protein n=1 Tax=Arundo donax TaxID=35708 RepID=A0A0A9CAM0_ARUDO